MDIWVGFQFLWFMMLLKWTSLLNKFLEVGLLGYRISMFKIFNMYCQMVFPKGYALTPSYQHVWECLSPCARLLNSEILASLIWWKWHTIFFFLQLLVRWSIFSFLWLFVFLLRIAALCDLSIFLQHCLSFF